MMQKDQRTKSRAIVALLPLIFYVASARADILIGFSVPLTGAQATVGQQILKGTQLAVEDINATGGVNGEKILVRCWSSLLVVVVCAAARSVAGHFRVTPRTRASKLCAIRIDRCMHFRKSGQTN